MDRIKKISVIAASILMFSFSLSTMGMCFFLSQELASKSAEILKLEELVDRQDSALTACTEDVLKYRFVLGKCQEVINAIDAEIRKNKKKTYHCKGDNGSCSVTDFLKHKKEQELLDSKKKNG